MFVTAMIFIASVPPPVQERSFALVEGQIVPKTAPGPTTTAPAVYMLNAHPENGPQHELACDLMPAHPDGLPLPRRYWAIAAIVLAIAMSVLDSSIVNVALPTIARDLGATSAASIWVVNAYQLAILVVLLPLAALGEVVGYRRVSQAGLVVFTLASLACACAPTLLTLSIARVIQGLGAEIGRASCR